MANKTINQLDSISSQEELQLEDEIAVFHNSTTNKATAGDILNIPIVLSDPSDANSQTIGVAQACNSLMSAVLINSQRYADLSDSVDALQYEVQDGMAYFQVNQVF